jgi:MFS family permease
MLKLRKARFAVSAYFLFGGTSMSVWAVHIPLIEKNLGLSHAALGSTLLLLGAGAFVSMQIMGWIIDHFGSRWPTVIGAIGTSVALALPGLADGLLTLAIALFVLGMAVGALDVSMNAHAVSVEKLYERPIFSAFHAFWSAGGMVGAIIGAATLGFSLPTQTTMPATGLALLVASLGLAPWLIKDSVNQDSVTGEPAKSNNDAESSAKPSTASTNRKYLGLVFLIGAMSFAAVIAEGSAVDWSAVQLANSTGASLSVAAWGLVAFSLTMTAGRLFGDALVARFGRYFVIKWGSWIGAVGLSIVAFTSDTALALVGWAILGAGVSSIVPQLFAASAEVGEPSHSGRNMAKVVGLTYAGILAGPAIIGWLTNWMTLSLALGIGAVLCCLVALNVPYLKKRVESR